ALFSTTYCHYRDLHSFPTRRSSDLKDGGIIPLMPPRLHAPAKGEKVDLEIRHYGGKPGSYRLYDDDGVSYNYQRGDYSFREIRFEKDANGEWKGSLSAPEPGKPNSVGKVTFRSMSDRKKIGRASCRERV